MRAFLALPALALLAACGPGVMSQSPLVASGGGQPADGLWAVLDDGCAPPTTGSLGNWPDCAMPVWIGKGIATALPNGTPNHFAFVMGDGDPHLLQVKGDMGKLVGMMASLGDQGPGAKAPDTGGAEAPAYFYWSFVPEGNAPWKRAKVWRIACPKEDLPGLPKAAEGQDSCEASTLAALQAASKLPAETDKVQVAVWVAKAD